MRLNRRRALRSSLLLPLAAAAWPLLAGPSPQEADDPADRGGDDVEASEPTRTAGSSLTVGALGRAAAFSQEDRLRDAPFLVARRDGRATLGWLEYVPGKGDELMAFTAPVEKLAAGKNALQPVTLQAAPLLRPVGVVDAADRLLIAWTELVDGVGQLRAAREVDGSFARPLELTAGPHVSMNPDLAALPDGTVWWAWEAEIVGAAGERPQREILAAPLIDDARLGEITRISDHRGSDVDARIACAGGRLWIAWASFTGRDYEIRLRSLDPATRALGPLVDVSARSQADDIHPALAAAPDGALWVAWDSCANPLRGDSTPPQLRLERKRVEIDVAVRCARVLPDGTVQSPVPRTPGLEPGVVEGAIGLSVAGGLPNLQVDARGQPWIAYRQLVSGGSRKSHGWTVLLQPLEAAGFGAPLEVAASTGTLAESALAACGDRVVVAFATDHRLERNAAMRSMPAKVAQPLERQGVTFESWRGPFLIGAALAPVPAADAPAPGLPPLVPRVARLDAPHFHPAGDPEADPFVAGTRHFEVVRGDERYSVYWGDLHRHSCISRCSAGFEPTPQDRFATGRDVHRCDFMALTDHSGQIHPLAWWQIDKLTQLYLSPGFVTLAGYEWSTAEWGHHNVILPGRLTPFIGQISDLGALFKALPKDGAVTIPHHPADNSFANDWTECDDRFTRLVEIFQSRRGNFEFDGCFKQAPNAGSLGAYLQDALQQGHHYGIIASSDHAEGQAYACVLAERLDRASLFAALRARRTYGATTKGMFVDLRVDDALMGEAIEIATPPRVRLTAHGLRELSEVVIFRNGKPWQRAGPEPASEPNGFAPIRVVVRVAADGAPPTADARLAFKVKGGRFGQTEERRPYSRRRAVPWWESDGARAELACPEGFDAQPFMRDFPLRVIADLEATLELTLPGGTKASRTLRELAATPLAGELPGGGPFTVAIDLGDGALPFRTGLGTRDFTGEWTDADLRSGKSWYYARLIQVDGEIAWSSPIFVERK
ncbi:MAG: hypothetical protein FJ293_10990 [Planctomycetes bacterium]|nr:hypothetical protein [Planctomycetota bacterium]